MRLRNRLTALSGVELVVMTPDDPGHCVMRPAPHRGCGVAGILSTPRTNVRGRAATSAMP